jgi:glycosyltransferase involved in cell wall biosynthesis
MNDPPGISVVLPNFNHGAFVGSALHELLSQSPAPMEIIVIDDASTDDSLAVIGQIASANPSIRLLANSENLGVIRTLKRGLEIATGRYVYLAAADDWVVPGFFSLALHMLSNHPQAGLFCGDAILVDGASGSHCGHRPVVRPFYRAGAADAEDTRRMLWRFDNWILTGSAIFRRDALLSAGGLDETCGSFADGYLLRKIALTSGFCYAPQVVSAWRIFPSGVSRQTALDCEKAMDILRIVPPKISGDPAFPVWYADLFCNRWRFAASRLATETNPINYAVLDSMAGDSPFDTRMLKLIRLVFSPLGSLERIATLAWLAIRLHPYPLSALIATRLSRWRCAPWRAPAWSRCLV